LRLGVIKELKPDMVATSSEPADVVGGHPFIVEAAVSLGGRSVETGVNIYRFANRIPLLFEPGSDIIRVVALNQIKWNLYKINPNSDKVGVFVSLVSTKIPFKGTGKEYIGDDDGRIGSVVKRAIQQCCAQLRTKITRRLLTMEKQNRKTALSENIPPVSKALFSILNKITEVKEQALSATWCVSCSDEAKTRLAPSDLLKRVSREEITEKTLKRRLAEYVSKLEASDLLEGPQEEAQQERLKLYVAYFDLGREPMLEMQSDKFIFYAPKWLFS
jgi:DNA topoisomerase-6 subunit B